MSFKRQYPRNTSIRIENACSRPVRHVQRSLAVRASRSGKEGVKATARFLSALRGDDECSTLCSLNKKEKIGGEGRRR